MYDGLWETKREGRDSSHLRCRNNIFHKGSVLFSMGKIQEIENAQKPSLGVNQNHLLRKYDFYPPPAGFEKFKKCLLVSQNII